VKVPREIRRWPEAPFLIVKLADHAHWAVVRAVNPGTAKPFVIRRREWDALPVEYRPKHGGDQ
jgi:hypothetical protein